MDLATFEALCEKHRRPVLAYALTCSRDIHLAEDIAQETLLIALKKREAYFPEADFGSWLISIARNVWFRERDKRRIAERSSRWLHDHASLLFPAEDYEDERWEGERKALSGCVAKLAETDRDLIGLHFSAGMPYAEIAERLERTLSWVKVRMYRARAGLLRCIRISMGEPVDGPGAGLESSDG